MDFFLARPCMPFIHFLYLPTVPRIFHSCLNHCKNFCIGKEIAPLLLVNKSYHMAVGLGSETEVLVKGMPNQVVEGLVSGRDNKIHIMFAAYFGFFLLFGIIHFSDSFNLQYLHICLLDATTILMVT
ncbi:hypothetical protein ACJX0J_036306 [Zea mays]